jgi:hypothetical protein
MLALKTKNYQPKINSFMYPYLSNNKIVYTSEIL